MAELKTKENDGSVEQFLNSVENERRRTDAWQILHLMQEVTGEEPRMWGDSIIGYGHYKYQYKSGREAEWFLVGFSPRKQNLTLYIMSGFDQYDALMSKLGKHKTGKSCLYINKLADIDQEILKELVRLSAQHMVESNR